MQVSAVSSSQAFLGKAHKRDNIDKEIFKSDKELQALAYLQTVEKSRKRDRNVKRLFMAVPLIAAAAAGLLTHGNASLFSREVSGLAAKTVNAAKHGGYWAMILGGGVALAKGTSAAREKSKTVRNFTANHPFLTLAGQFAALYAGLTYLPKGAAKLYNMIKPEVIAKAGKSVGEIAEHINKLKAPEFMRNWGKTISSHTPEVVKDVTEATLAWAPEITAATAGIAMLKSCANVVADYNNTYLNLKDRQSRLAQARIRELKSQQL